MLRGIDATNARGEDAVMVKVADRVEIDGELTVYMQSNPPDYVRDRQRTTRELFETLAASGALDPVPIIEWPERTAYPSDDTAAEAYEEFVTAVGPRSLEPFFERQSSTGTDDYVVHLPPVCIALRSDGVLRGLYPHWEAGTHHSIEDCLTALSLGEPIANVVP